MPESFRVLVKELQSLCLDIRVMDADGNEIELKDDDDDDDVVYATGSENFVTNEDEVFASGFNVDEDSTSELDSEIADILDNAAPAGEEE